MEYNESNFFYLKKTNMSKYYDELVKAECVCEYFPIVTKIIVRKVMEVFLKDIAEKSSIDADVSVGILLSNVKLSSNISVPEKIYNYIETVLFSGYENSSQGNKNGIISKHPIEILETMHYVLCWYLRKTVPEIMMSFEDLSFKAPNTIEYMEKEASKIKDDILLKSNQINDLRQKIIESAGKITNVGKINNIIIRKKEEKSNLEKMQTLLFKKIIIQKNHVAEVESNHKSYVKACDNLKKKCDESQELLFEKESQLVKVEIQRQELKNSIKKLDYEDYSIKKMELALDQEMGILRDTYDNLSKLTNEYQDILETVEFSYDKELQEILGAKKNNIKVKMNFEDGIFNENIIKCTRNIAEAKRKVIIFREIVNEKINREIKYELLYKSFLRLNGRELRILYTILNVTANLLNKPRELFAKSNEDKILENVTKNLEELRNVDDEEIKLIIYCKLIKLSKSALENIFSKRQFIRNLDSAVEKSYEILMSKKDFDGKIKQLDSIIEYYLQKVILLAKSKGNSKQINEEMISKVCNKILELRQRTDNIGKMYYEKFNLDIMSEAELKANIEGQFYTFLSIMLNLGDINSYRDISLIIFEVYNMVNQSFNEYDGKNPLARFSNEYFMVLLFLSDENTFLAQMDQEELLPLLTVVIMAADFFSDNEEVNLNSYNKMIYIWKQKQQRYSSIFIKKEEEESALELLMQEKKRLEVTQKDLMRNYNNLVKNYDSYKDEFKRIIMNSEKRILLPSYINYEELRIRKEKAENNINRSKDKLGTLKSIVSPSMWKEQASRFINESNMEEAEKRLIEEAKQKPYFKKEYLVFIELEEKIKQVNGLIERNKGELQYKESKIADIQTKINELNRLLATIKEVYVDIEEGYY